MCLTLNGLGTSVIRMMIYAALYIFAVLMFGIAGYATTHHN
jgi:hypothetical protein